ncbi:co-chaperone GroES family protein [Pseudoalteromonas sp. DL2-H2.2]|uniref:co-chaperone GroES family protein n=1 Tax=Pseudoalteromonas sp. DL2-H2.2 TaxID=2908889 RepID=UPI001F343FA0|nr:co-chaperone GroES family protein [Pseudoalteromonas sp. DL2-H2.2]MCF2909989.1 co-chaperone GroES family protein [Pseudoalteromonas sp. DL2-H2.2]
MTAENIKPIGDIAILKVIPNEQKIGTIVLAGSAIEPSTLCEVMVPNEVSYHRNGEPKSPHLKAGDVVRIPKGSVGTEMPEAPDGETWLAVPDDCILYIVGDSKNGS